MENNNDDNDTSIHHDYVLNNSSTSTQSNQSMSTHALHLPFAHSDECKSVTISIIYGQMIAQAQRYSNSQDGNGFFN
ncbi:hypothetical protein GJ496_003446 [Pomphorhynchus laevis]|nr:hypothetical protein GJ496_003446 [Pomphorhynchus laevis]